MKRWMRGGRLKRKGRRRLKRKGRKIKGNKTNDGTGGKLWKDEGQEKDHRQNT